MEIVCLCDEVRFTVYFDQYADMTVRMNIRSDSTFRRIRSAFFAAVASPFSRRYRLLFAISPSVSTSAFLHSIIPAPERVRSSFTKLAVILYNLHKNKDLFSGFFYYFLFVSNVFCHFLFTLFFLLSLDVLPILHQPSLMLKVLLHELHHRLPESGNRLHPDHNWYPLSQLRYIKLACFFNCNFFLL